MVSNSTQRTAHGTRRTAHGARHTAHSTQHKRYASFSPSPPSVSFTPLDTSVAVISKSTNFIKYSASWKRRQERLRWDGDAFSSLRCACFCACRSTYSTYVDRERPIFSSTAFPDLDERPSWSTDVPGKSIMEVQCDIRYTVSGFRFSARCLTFHFSVSIFRATH